jgi:tetratricopeptide (TPR) repeat protein
LMRLKRPTLRVLSICESAKGSFMRKQDFTLALIIRLTVCAVAVAFVFTSAPRSFAQDNSSLERKLAFDLLGEGKFAEAQEKFEKLIAANPSDGDAQFGLGYSLIATSKNISDENARRQARIRARNALLRAKELGATNDLLEPALAAIAPDGTETVVFSKDDEADKAMKDGEAAFTRGDYDHAIEAYQRALKLQPQLYHAALFIGDAYFQKNQVDKAGEWYGRAITINPDRETAYRYWSDVLMKNGRMDEARAKAIEAIVAEPYNRMAYAGLVQWARRNNVSLAHPTIDQPPPSMRSSQDGNNQTTITIDPKALDPKQGPAYYWGFYDLTRAAYPATFNKDYPGETTYRHNLKEEASALRVVAEMVASDLKSGKLKSVDDTSLANLLKLHQADLLEPYVLFGRPDEGISQDYLEYRKTHRDKLKQYWAEIVISKGN